MPPVIARQRVPRRPTLGRAHRTTPTARMKPETRMNPTPRDIGPFQLDLIKSCLDTVAGDMAFTPMCTAHSGIACDSFDFSTALIDAEGLMLAQGIRTPMHIGQLLHGLDGLGDIGLGEPGVQPLERSGKAPVRMVSLELARSRSRASSGT